MKPLYIRIEAEGGLPNELVFSSFKTIVIAQQKVSDKWRDSVSSWLVNQGTRYVMAWGDDCSLWDDAVDEVSVANELSKYVKQEFVMTTWHESESLEGVFNFAKTCAVMDKVIFDGVLILHIGVVDSEVEFLDLYNQVDEDVDKSSWSQWDSDIS